MKDAVLKGLDVLDNINPFSVDEKTQEQIDAYGRGEISEAELAAQAPAQVGRSVGDVLGWPIEQYLKYTPTGVAASTALGWAGNKLAESAPGQAVAQWAEENPRTVNNLSTAADISELFPLSAGVRRGMNAIMSNVETKLPGFYDGAQIRSFWEQLKETPAVTLNQLVNPQAQANIREKGEFAGERRLTEMTEGAQKDRTGNVLATDLMGSQSANKYTPSLVGESSIVKESYVGRHMDTDRDSIVRDAGEDPVITGDLYDRARVAHSGTNKLEKMLGFVADPLGTIGFKKPAMVGVRNSSSGWGSLHQEAAGINGKGSKAINLFRGPEADRYAQAIGKESMDDLDAEELAQFLRVGNVFERGNWYGVKAELGMPDADYKGLFSKYVTAMKKDPLKRTPAQNRLVNAIEKRADGTYTPGPKTKQETFRYHKLKNKKGKLTEKEQEFVDWFDASRAPAGANVSVERLSDGREVVKYRTSFTSGDTDLGGVSGGYTLDPAKKEIYGMVSDQHDMFGVNPIGGSDMYNVSQVQRTGYGKDNKTSTAEVQAKGKQTEAGKARMEADSKAIQMRTGIHKQPDESDYGYQTRAIREYNADIRAQDVGNAAANVGMLSGAILPDQMAGVTAGGLPAYLMNTDSQEKFQDLRSLVGTVTGQSAEQLLRGIHD